jgi:hypothetical protein
MRLLELHLGKEASRNFIFISLYKRQPKNLKKHLHMCGKYWFIYSNSNLIFYFRFLHFYLLYKIYRAWVIWMRDRRTFLFDCVFTTKAATTYIQNFSRHRTWRNVIANPLFLSTQDKKWKYFGNIMHLWLIRWDQTECITRATTRLRCIYTDRQFTC